MSVKVSVADLVGRSLELELPATETAKAIKDAVAKSWALDPATFRLLAKAERMDEEMKLESFLKEGQMELEVQLLKCLYPPWELFFYIFVYIKPKRILTSIIIIKVLRGSIGSILSWTLGSLPSPSIEASRFVVRATCGRP